MNDQASEAAGITTTRTVPLDKPLVRTGGETIDAVQLRKPGSGELRGLSLVDLTQLQVTTLHKLLPRITTPMLTEHDVAQLDPADLLAIGAELADFLLQRRQKPASLGA